MNGWIIGFMVWSAFRIGAFIMAWLGEKDSKPSELIGVVGGTTISLWLLYMGGVFS